LWCWCCCCCFRPFTSARLLDRHTYAVHEPKQDSYDDRNYQTNEVEDEDDVRDYADDELEEKPKANINMNANQLKLEEGITDDEQGIDEEEQDLAPNVEDIVEGDEDYEPIPTIKSISSAGKKKRVGVVRKFDNIDDEHHEEVPNKRRCITRGSRKSNEDVKPDFDVFGFDG